MVSYTRSFWQECREEPQSKRGPLRGQSSARIGQKPSIVVQRCLLKVPTDGVALATTPAPSPRRTHGNHSHDQEEPSRLRNVRTGARTKIECCFAEAVLPLN